MNARKAHNLLKDTLERTIDAEKEPALYAICEALREIAKALVKIEEKIDRIR